MSRLPAVIAAVGLMLAASSASAMEFEITPFTGAVVPNQTSIISSNGSSAFRNHTHLLLGVAVSTPVASWLDLELAGAVGGGETEVVGATANEIASSLLIGDLRARVRMVGGDNAELGLLAGVGWTQFRSALFDVFGELSTDIKLEGKLTGVVGLGLRARLSERLRLTFDAVDRIHDNGLEGDTLTGLIQPTQHDIAVTAGLTFPLN